jgi:transcription elongation factor Elf1
MIEHYFDCPHCWENQLKMIDNSISNQNFIEDCETCCNPLEFNLTTKYNSLISFSVEPIGQ